MFIKFHGCSVSLGGGSEGGCVSSAPITYIPHYLGLVLESECTCAVVEAQFPILVQVAIFLPILFVHSSVLVSCSPPIMYDDPEGYTHMNDGVP